MAAGRPRSAPLSRRKSSAPLRLDPGRRRETEVTPLPLATRRHRHVPGAQGALGTANHRAQPKGREWAERAKPPGTGGRAKPLGKRGAGCLALFFFFFLNNYYFLMNRSVRTSAKNPRATFALLKVTTRRQAVRQQSPVREGSRDTPFLSPTSTYRGEEKKQPKPHRAN